MHGSINRQNGNFESKSSKERKIPMFILCKMKNSAPLFKYVYNITITCSPLFQTRENSHVQMSCPYTLDFKK